MSAAMSTKSDCGCGGSSSGGCGCGGGDCGCGGHDHGQKATGSSQTVCTDQSFRQPRFFPNQLLTHDSLQGLVDYVVGKNRLHNRFMWGDGVVCGLTATCHPCGEGKITVASGYALDCCGNDILVPCPEDLDIKALVRDLRKRQMAGYDCGDPCDDKDNDGLESYGLYIVYDEVPVDPVAPYNSGDPCGQQSCEPSQICEGYRFELRCDCKGPDRVNVWDRIKACIGDLGEATAAFSKAKSAQLMAQRTLEASRAVASEEEIAFDRVSIATLAAETEALAPLNALDLDDVDENGELRVLPSERELRLNVARAQVLTGAVTRFRILPEEVQASLLEENQDLAGQIEAAQAVLMDAAPRLEALAPRVMTTSASRIEAEDTARIATRYGSVETAESVFLGDRAKFVALNTPVSARSSIAMQTAAMQVKAWLIEKLSNSNSLTRCDLLDRLRRINLDDIPNTDAAGINAASQGVIDLIYILIEYLIDCICLALNPPCRPCDDTGVLLACLKVKDCEVVDICNLSRSYVLTPVAMRYWLPPIGIIGDLFKRLCCDFELKRRAPKEQTPQESIPELIRAESAVMPIVTSYAPSISAASLDESAVLALREFNIAPDEVETVSAFASNLGLLSAGAANLDIGGAALRGNRVLDNVLGARRVFDPADVNVIDDQVRTAVAAELDVVRRDARETVDAVMAERLTSSLSDVRAEVETSIATTLESRLSDNVSATVGQQLESAAFRTAVKNNTTVKALQTENRKLKADLKKMATAIERLEKRVEK